MSVDQGLVKCWSLVGYYCFREKSLNIIGAAAVVVEN